MTPWAVASQASLYMGFPRPEYWSGLVFLHLGDLPGSGIKPASLALVVVFFTTEPPAKPKENESWVLKMSSLFWKEKKKTQFLFLG